MPNLTFSSPPRPPAWEERLSSGLFRLLSPRLARAAQLDPPPELAPWQHVEVPRLEGKGILSATWFEAPSPGRGGVLLLHPWLAYGRSYFHRRGRVEALRAAGYHAMAMDLAGFGTSSAPAGFFDRDVAAGIAYMRGRLGRLPLHVWGVSSGGYWAHPTLGEGEIAGAMFEDVAPHLVEWSWRMEPWKRPGYLAIRHCFARSYRFIDMRRHVPPAGLAAAYVSGAEDPAVRPEDTRALAERAGGRHLIVPGAGHLGAFKTARGEILALALKTFAEGEARRAAG